MAIAHPARHLLRTKDLMDARYREPLDVATLARAARLSPWHFSREFRRAFGSSPHRYLLERRLERAASLLRTTDRSVADICLTVGLRSVGSFTTSFGGTFGMTPTEYRASHPPAMTYARVPTCVLMVWARPDTARWRRQQKRPCLAWPPRKRVEEDTMLTKLTSAQVWVRDQNEALAFYTEKLGLELREDVTVPELGNFRWLRSAFPGSQTSGSRC